MEYKYSVELMRFKQSGKYYDTVSYGTNFEHMFQISEQIEADIKSGFMYNGYYYLLTGKDSDGVDLPNGYPVLIKGHL